MKMLTARTSALLIALSSCGGSQSRSDEPIGPVEPLGSTHVAPPGTMPPDTRPPPLDAPPPEVQQFASALGAVGESGRLDHARLVVALEAMARALVVVAPRDRERVRAIVDTARRLDNSPDYSLLHADYVKTALEHALIALTSGTPRDRLDTAEYLREVTALATLVRAIDPTEPLLPQHDQVVSALYGILATLEKAIGVAIEVPKPPPQG